MESMGEKRNFYTDLVGKHAGHIPLGRHGCRWEDDIKMDHKEIKWVDWIHLAYNRDKWLFLFNTFHKIRRIS